MKTIQDYMDEGVLRKPGLTGWLVEPNMERARKNLQIMEALDRLQGSKEAKKLLDVPEDLTTTEWVIITGYYGMYLAAQAALAKIGYTTTSHQATIVALDTFYVQKKLIEPKYLDFLKQAELEKEHVQQLQAARRQREKAQYHVTETPSTQVAAQIRENSKEFVSKIDEILTK